jgi:hypothetical protein
MKIIITENQKNETEETLIDEINERGFMSAAQHFGLSLMKLAKLSNIGIEAHSDEENIPMVEDFLEELVNRNNVYNNCKINYESGFISVISWECNFNFDNKDYIVFGYATPYEDGSYETIVEIGKITIDGDTENFFTELEDTFKNPQYFSNIKELVDWFENTYKPKTYEIFVKLFDKYIIEYL